jgi:hypothetical protein
VSDTQALYSVIRGDILSPANSGPVFCDANFKVELQVATICILNDKSFNLNVFEL